MKRNSGFPRPGHEARRAHPGRRLRTLVQRVTGSILASCMLLALFSCAADSVNDRREGQLIVCHKGKHTMAVSNADSFLHLDHGDTLGPCPEQK